MSEKVMSEKEERRHLMDDDYGHGCCGGWQSLITVEPAAFLFILAYILAASTTQQYVTYSSAVALGADPSLLTTSLCDLTSNMTASVSQVEAEAAGVLTIFSLLNILPMLLAAVLMGSYSDSKGRKVALIAPVIGGLLRGVAVLAICYYNLNIQFLYGAGLLEGLFGGTSVFSTAMFAYIADVSRVKNRSWRMLVVMLVQALGIGVAEVSAGYMITYLGFIYPFMMILGIYFACLLCVLFYMRETVFADEKAAGYFSFTHFKRTFRPLMSSMDKGRRWIMRMCTTVMCLSYICQGIVGYSLYLYVAQWPLCFSWVQVGYLMGVSCVVQTVGGSAAFKLFYRKLKDAGLLVLASSTGVLAKVWYAVPIYNAVYVFVEPVIGALTFLIEPLARALMSKAAGADEQGAVQAIGSVVNVTGNLLGSVLASYVYSVTADFFTGMVFLMAALTMLILLAFALVLHCCLGKNDIPDPDVEDYQLPSK